MLANQCENHHGRPHCAAVTAPSCQVAVSYNWEMFCSLWLTLVPYVACYPYYKCCLLWLINAWVPYLLHLLSCVYYMSGSLVWYSVYVVKVVLSLKFIKAGEHTFSKNTGERCRNCGCQKGNSKQVLFWRPSDIGYYRRKFSHLGFVHLCSKVPPPLFCQYNFFYFPIIVFVACYLMTASC